MEGPDLRSRGSGGSRDKCCSFWSDSATREVKVTDLEFGVILLLERFKCVCVCE